MSETEIRYTESEDGPELWATFTGDNITTLDKLRQLIESKLRSLETFRQYYGHVWGTKAMSSTNHVLICASVARRRFQMWINEIPSSTEPMSFGEEYDWFNRLLIECTKKAAADPAAAPSKEDDGISIAEDFTSATWGPKKFEFARRQAECVRVLWEARGKGDGTLSERSIGAKIKSDNANFRLIHVFRVRKAKGKRAKRHQTDYHPAWGTMIAKAGKGIYKIVGHRSGTGITE